LQSTTDVASHSTLTMAKETPIPLPPRRFASTNLNTKKPSIDPSATVTKTVVAPKPQVRKPTTKSISQKPAPKKANKDSAPTQAPIYDSLGYELSPTRIQRASRRYRKPSNYEAYEARMQKDRKEQIRKCEIMGTPREKVSAMTLMAWDDRVARELGIEYHKVEMKHFEELKRRGFVAKEGEFKASNMSKEERERITTLATRSAFRR
jgi:hypothetical protein